MESVHWSQTSTADQGIFTEYVEALLDSGRDPDPDTTRATWASLKRIVIRQMKKRSIWSAPPSYLGFRGSARWTDGDALEDLVADCYQFVFIDRLRSLRGYLMVNESIDAFVVHSVRNFLHDLQRREDPLGAGVFRLLRKVVREAIDEGWLRIQKGSTKVSGDTVLAFGRKMRIWKQPPREAPEALLAELASNWNETLMPGLVVAQTRAQALVLEQLRGFLRAMPRQGVETFQFRNLVKPLQTDARHRWRGVAEKDLGGDALESDGNESRAVQQVFPDTYLEERQFQRQLVERVDSALRTLETRKRTKEYLFRLWDFLKLQASMSDTNGQRLPDRRVARLLEIPRERLPGLYEILEQVTLECQSALSGQLSN